MTNQQKMEKTAEQSLAQKKQIKKAPFYKLWWFWLIIGTFFIGSWFLFFITDLNIRTTIIGILGIWGSAFATIFIGIIAAKQNEHFTFNTRKEQLINEVSESIITFNQWFYKIFNLHFINNLKREITKLPSLKDKLEFLKAQKEITYKLLEFSQLIDEFDNSLLKSILVNEEVNKFKEAINELQNYFEEILKDYSKKEKNIKEEQKDFISNWIKKIMPFKFSVSNYGLKLKKRIFDCTTLKDLNLIEQEIFHNQKDFLD